MSQFILGLIFAIWSGVLIAIKYLVAIAVIYGVMWLGWGWFMDKNPEYKAAYEGIKEKGVVLLSKDEDGKKGEKSEGEQGKLEKLIQLMKQLKTPEKGAENAR